MANRTCSIDGCETPARKRGWCDKHYERWRRHGSTEDSAVSHTWAEKGSPCVVCGGPVPEGIGRRKHCSESCKSAQVWHQGKRPDDATCVMCGKKIDLGRRPGGRFQRTDTLWCRDCGRTSPEANRLKRHGVRPERYAAAMLKGCEICGEKTDLHVDHNHSCCPPTKYRKCGQCVRGFLCGSCNRAIGLLRDDPELIAKAADYLSASRQ